MSGEVAQKGFRGRMPKGRIRKRDSKQCVKVGSLSRSSEDLVKVNKGEKEKARKSSSLWVVVRVGRLQGLLLTCPRIQLRMEGT